MGFLDRLLRVFSGRRAIPTGSTSSADTPLSGGKTEPQLIAHEDQQTYAIPDDYEVMPVLTLRPWDYGQGVAPDAHGFGFETEDGKVWPASNCRWAFWESLGVLVLKVVGQNHHPGAMSDRSFDPGRPLTLVLDPRNPFDPKAFSIRNVDGSLTCGYFTKGLTSRVKSALRGQDCRVMALSCRMDDLGMRRTMKVVLFRPDRLRGAESIPQHLRLS